MTGGRGIRHCKMSAERMGKGRMDGAPAPLKEVRT